MPVLPALGDLASKRLLIRHWVAIGAGTATIIALLVAIGPRIAGAAVAVAALAILLRWPAIGIYAAIACAPLHVYRRPLGPMNVSLFRLLILLTALSLIVHLILRTSRITRRRPPAFVFIAAAFIVAYLAEAIAQSQRSLTGLGWTIFGQRLFFLASALVLALGLFCLRLNRKTLVRVAVFSAIPPFMLGLYQWSIGSPSEALPFQRFIKIPGDVDVIRSGGFAEHGLRPAATFSDPNFFAIFAAMTFVLADGIARGERGLLWIANLLLRVMSLTIIVMTESRTGLVIVFVYLLATWLPRLAVPLWLKATMAGVLAAGMLLFVFAPGPLEVLGRGNPAGSTEQHLETRLSAVGIGLAHPLRGVGIGNVGPLLGEPPDRSSAHALPFTVFAEEGVGGLILCLVALGFPFTLMLRRVGRGAALGLTLGVCVGMLLYDFMFILDVAAAWWALALAYADEPVLEKAPQRRTRLTTALRNFFESAKARPPYTADAPTASSAARHAPSSSPPAKRAARYTVARPAANAPV